MKVEISKPFKGEPWFYREHENRTIQWKVVLSVLSFFTRSGRWQWICSPVFFSQGTISSFL